MNVLVSGSRGFIGSALVARLEREGHVVHRIVRSGATPARSAEASPQAATVTLEIGAGRLDVSALPHQSLEGIDAVFHLAGEPITPWRWSATKRERMRSSRVVTTDIVARAVASAPEPRPALISMSAIGYYGERGEEAVDEASPAGTGTLADLCRAWEAAAAPARDAGARVVNLRTGVVLGRGGGSLALEIPLFRLGLGARLGSGRQWTSWISLEDEVGALLHVALDPSIEGPANATSPAPVRNAAFTDALAAALSRRALLAVPRRVLELVAGAEVTREMLCVSERVLPATLERTGYHFAHPDLEAALRAVIGPTSGPATTRTAGTRR
jgi:hypothetical protein